MRVQHSVKRPRGGSLAGSRNSRVRQVSTLLWCFGIRSARERERYIYIECGAYEIAAKVQQYAFLRCRWRGW